jgi:probable F420-dependent oxidoreductase
VTADLGRVGVWGHLDTLPIAAARDFAARADALGYSALWVPETVGREPFTLLGLLAGHAGRMVLGTSIVNIWGRDAQATRMAARTLAEATGGRAAIGLGVSHPHLAGKLRGHEFARPLSRMREYLAKYRAAIVRAPALDGVPEPPVLIAALRERMIDLAATDADGAFPYLVTTQRVTWIRRRLDVTDAERRPMLAVTVPVAPEDADPLAAARAYLRPYLRTPAYQASWELQGFGPGDWEAPGSEPLVRAMVATSVADGRARIAEMHDAGADHVALVPLGPDGSTESTVTLEAMASLERFAAEGTDG